jgi:hypothetical protein
MSNFKDKLIYNLLNVPGWHTNRKIVVIESDDWGSIRMPSREVYEALLYKGIRVDNLSYNRYDSLASEEDLTALFEVLSSVKDKNGNPAIFTANTIMANPDFDKIKKSDFIEYYYEPFTETLKRYPKHDKSFDLWKEGISNNIFKPQFHGREHLNVTRWMKALREDVHNVRLAFDYRMFDLSTSYAVSDNSFVEALNSGNEEELGFHQRSIIGGTQLFENIFGFKSGSFISPCFIWSSMLNETFKKCGINTFQGSYYQFEPLKNSINKLRKRIHFTGQKNELLQYFLTRNVSFEPSENLSLDWVGIAMSQIANSFFWGKPAIISSHRMNYIGYIDQKNRERNLILLSCLLKGIKKGWPDVEFMDSQQLGDLIRNQS